MFSNDECFYRKLYNFQYLNPLNIRQGIQVGILSKTDRDLG